MKRFCGRDFSGQEMRRLCELIGEDPTRSRAQLSRLACQLLGWFKPDGGLKEMSCRVAMLRMHRQGCCSCRPLATRREARAHQAHFLQRTATAAVPTRARAVRPASGAGPEPPRLHFVE